MRDYAEILLRLKSSDPEAAEALQELVLMAGKMTSLGADLEEQVREQLSTDFYSPSSEEFRSGVRYLFSADSPDLRDMSHCLAPYLTPMAIDSLHLVGVSYFVLFPEEQEPREFFSEDEANKAIEEFKSRDPVQ